MKQSFYSNGKLLITGEYLVLDGAEALAVPTKYGQTIEIVPNNKKSIVWKSMDANLNIWFEAELFWTEIIENKILLNFSETKKTLIQILHYAWRANPTADFIQQGFDVVTQLSFPRAWGLGTSSTLINNIAKWFQVNPFILLSESFGGSGYDIACAETDQPIIYQRIEEQPLFKSVAFEPTFHENIYFVYLNKKQNSSAAIAAYYNKRQNVSRQIREISSITQQIIHCTNESNFQHLLLEHEAILSNILEMETVQETYFSDFNGVVKSLGAWGGDFVLVHSKSNPKMYFQNKGYQTILNFKEMVLG
ncbi:MAG: GYDIA family GHMP kinase [Flavobacterium sp.]